MRVVFGVVLGAILTVGAAYYRDANYASATAPVPSRPLVNWDVAAEIAGNATRIVRRQIDELLQR